MKILFVTSKHLPHFGGLEYHVTELTSRLIEQGFRVEVIADRIPRETSSFECINSVPVYRINHYPADKNSANNSPIKAPLYLMKIRERIGEFDPDIIHAHTISPAGFCSLLYNKLAKKPLVITNHEQISAHSGLPFSRFFYRWISKNADAIICVCEALRKEILDLGVDDGKLSVIYNGMDASKYNTNGFTADSDEAFVLTICRLTPSKGVKYLIEASKQLPDVPFVIIGDGEERKYLESISGNNVIFLGNVPDSVKIDYLKRCSFYVSPSINEGFSIVLLESLAAGKPVIATDVGGSSETIINNYNGFLVVSKNSTALAEKISFLLRNEKLMKTMGENAYKTVCERFDWSIIVDETIEVYEKVLRK